MDCCKSNCCCKNDCCKENENIQKEQIKQDLIVYTCKICGRKHYELTVDAGKLFSKFN